MACGAVTCLCLTRSHCRRPDVELSTCFLLRIVGGCGTASHSYCCRANRVDRWPVALVLAFTCAPVALAQTLTFNEALAMAVREAPALRAGSARVDSAQLATAPAGELPDPSLVLGLDNVPVEGDDRFSTGEDFMTMQRIGVMQEFTSPAKRRARTEQAQAQVELMRADARGAAPDRAAGNRVGLDRAPHLGAATGAGGAVAERQCAA